MSQTSRRSRTPRGVYETPASPSPYVLTEEILAAIQTRGSNNATVIRALADEFHVPIYWMRERVLEHGKGVDHNLLLQQSDRVARALVSQMRTEENHTADAPQSEPEPPAAPPAPSPEDEPRERVCANPACGKVFSVQYPSSSKRYCSTDCFYHARTRMDRVEQVCANAACGKRFVVPLTNPGQRYCSRGCSHRKGMKMSPRTPKKDASLGTSSTVASPPPMLHARLAAPGVKLALHMEIEVASAAASERLTNAFAQLALALGRELEHLGKDR